MNNERNPFVNCHVSTCGQCWHGKIRAGYSKFSNFSAHNTGMLPWKLLQLPLILGHSSMNYFLHFFSCHYRSNDMFARTPFMSSVSILLKIPPRTLSERRHPTLLAKYSIKTYSLTSVILYKNKY